MRLTRFSVLVLVTVLARFTSAQDAAPKPEDTAKLVQNLMGIEVQFEQMQPHGASIEAREILREGKSGNGLRVEYHLFVKGAPPGTIFKQISWPVNADKPTSPMEGITVGKDGILMCAGRTPEECGDPATPDDPIEFILTPIKGEPARFAFLSSDFKIGTVLVPDPIETSDRGCTLSAIRLLPKFELAYISGSGYLPNTDVHYRLSTKTTDYIVKADSTGKIRTSIIGYSGKSETGTMKVKIEDSRCSPELSYEWGTL